MNPIEPDDRFDELLRGAMNDEAETVLPAGDGLSRIQQRVAARRARMRWMRPAMVAGSAAAVALAGFGAYAVVHGDANGESTVGVGGPPSPTASTTTAPTPSTTSAVPVSSVAFPQLALYPFTSAAAAKQWQQGYTSGRQMPWVADAKLVATNWIANYVQQPSVNKVLQTTYTSAGSLAAVQLGRTMTAEAGRTVPVTVVHEVKYGDAWIVTGATDGAPGNSLKFSAPIAGATVTSPLTVSGPGGWGVEPAATIEIRGANTPIVYGTGHASWGQNPAPWSDTVHFSTPSESVGMVVVYMTSQADSGPARIIVQPVRFSSTATASGPVYFYSVKNGRVTKFHATDGSSVDYLTDPQPGGGASDPQLSTDGTQVYYLQGGGSCANTLMKIPADGSGTPQIVASPDSGYVISSYSVIAGLWVSYYETACNGSTSPQAKLVTISSTGQRHVIEFPSQPPAIVGDPSFEPTASKQFLDAVVTTGHLSSLVRYNVRKDTSPTPGRNACPGFDPSNAMPGALQVDRAGVVWFATQTGSSMQVEHCVAGGNTATVAFTVAGNRTPADIAVTYNGSVLVTDTDGHIWRWNGNGDPVQLHPNVPLTQITW